ncbi:MAG: hypothetical protein C4297_01575 [Gemmataceae bacterium]
MPEVGDRGGLLHVVKNTCSKPPNEIKPKELFELYFRLRYLVHYWLRPELAKKVEDEVGGRIEKKDFAGVIGSCWIVFALKSPQEYPSLRPAFLLPLCWQRDRPHDHRLPPNLRALADNVMADLRREGEINAAQKWGLWLHPHFVINDSEPDFSNFDNKVSFNSGWGALFGGLYLANKGQRPNEKVWISAAYDPRRGIVAVGHVREKLELASEYDIKKFFLPRENVNEQNDAAGVHLVPLAQEVNKSPLACLGDYLRAHDVEPPTPQTEDDFKRYCEWYNRQHFTDHSEALARYLQNILPWVADKQRRHIRKSWPNCKPQTLVTVLSGSPELVALTAKTLEAKKLIVLCDRDLAARVQNQWNRVKAYLQQAGFSLDEKEFEIVSLESCFDRVRNLLPWSELAEDGLAVDLTPGTKIHSLALDRAAPPTAWRIYVQTEMQQPQRRPSAGSEQFIVWSPDSHRPTERPIESVVIGSGDVD